LGVSGEGLLRVVSIQTAQDLLHQGKLDEARKIYDRLIASDEGNADRAAQDYFDRASILQLQFRIAEAMADYGKAFQYRPDNPRYAGGYGYFAYQERDYTKAENGWTAVLQLYRELAARDPGAYRPNVALTLNNLGLLHRDTGRLAEAEKDYTEALATYRELTLNNPNIYDSRIAFLTKELSRIGNTLQTPGSGSRKHIDFCDRGPIKQRDRAH
jgi:tetratricopeptide (TPR) repeat protein